MAQTSKRQRPMYAPRRASASGQATSDRFTWDTRRATSTASAVNEDRSDMTVKRMDNVLIVVDDLEATKAFFLELGLKLEGRRRSKGLWSGN